MTQFMRLMATSGLALSIASPVAVYAQANQPAGKIVLAVGAVQIVRGGTPVQAKMGMEVRPGDSVRTATRSSAQLWLRDGGMISIREKSEFRIDSFNYRPGAPAAGQSSAASLVKGGARFLTGAVGKANPRGVTVNTRVATIGIRGTGYDLIDCVDQCFEENGSPAKAGLYGSVYEGSVTVTNDAGETSVLTTENFYIAERQAALIKLPVQPSFLAEPAAEGGTGKSTSEVAAVDLPVDAPSSEATQTGRVSDDKVANIPMPPPQQADTLTTPTVSYDKVGGGDGLPLSTAPSASFTLIAAEYNPADGQQNVQNIARGIKLSTSGGLIVGMTTPLFPDFPGYVIRGYSATLREGGADAGVVAWGRWADGSLLIGSWSGTTSEPKPVTLTAAQGFHWVVGEPAQSLPSAGVYTFNLIGATSPSETRVDAKSGWTVTAGSLTADITNASLSGNMTLYLARDEGYGYFDMDFASTSALTAGQATSIGTSVTRLNGSAPICTAVCNGIGQVYLFGNAPTKPASHAGMTYNFNTGDYLVSGAAVFAR